MIDKFGLGPFAKPQVLTNFSSYVSHLPIALQKTFILPKLVTVLHRTVTANRITNRNLLIAFQIGQLFSLDRRQINPRRPIGPPSKSELEEGLMQYNPYVMLNPLSYLTRNFSVASIHGMESASSMLESTSLVFAYGFDLHFARDMPSNGFDMLSSDFNRSQLILILSSIALAVIVLRKLAKVSLFSFSHNIL